jgi:hypothetical protein
MNRTTWLQDRRMEKEPPTPVKAAPLTGTGLHAGVGLGCTPIHVRSTPTATENSRRAYSSRCANRDLNAPQ